MVQAPRSLGDNELRALLDQMMSGVLVYDRGGRLLYHNSSSLRLLGLEESSPELQSFEPKRYFDRSGSYVDPADYPLFRAIREGRAVENEILGFRRGERQRWILCSAAPLEPGSELTAVSFFDYTAFKETEDRLELYFRDVAAEINSKERLLLAANVFASISEGITITDSEGSILAVNSAFSAITGYSAEEAIGRNPRILKSQYHDEAFYREMWRSIKERGSWQGEIINRRKDGTVYPEWLSISTVRDSSGAASRYVAVFSDRSDAKAREDRISRLKYHDILTDLPNRFLFLDRVGESLRMAEREGAGIAVLYFDFEKFKYVNSTWGYLAGDSILREAGARIQRTIRKADTVARIGGDEYAILLPNVDKAESALRAAKSVLGALSEPYEAGGEKIFLSASGGIAVWPGDGSSPDELVANATIAAKSPQCCDSENPHLYAASMGEKIRQRLDLEGRLRRAIERESFELFYQARVRVEDGSIPGMEALVRWREEDGSLISPADFIPLAEETGLIVPLGEWVLREALRATRLWREAGHEIAVSVNLSARQFRDRDVKAMVLRALSDTGYPPEALELEITESVAMSEMTRTVEVMNSLAESGIRFSLDDFGTGYSSFYYLKKLPIDWLKIDQSFVREMASSSGSEIAIVKAIVSMAKSLGLGTIAEGCENEEQFRYLSGFGCDQIQGFLFSRPLPEADFARLLERSPLALPGR